MGVFVVMIVAVIGVAAGVRDLLLLLLLGKQMMGRIRAMPTTVFLHRFLKNRVRIVRRTARRQEGVAALMGDDHFVREGTVVGRWGKAFLPVAARGKERVGVRRHTLLLLVGFGCQRGKAGAL